MKISKPITLWDKMMEAINNLEYDEPKELVTDLDVVERLIELAYHYRLECNRLQDVIDDINMDAKEFFDKD